MSRPCRIGVLALQGDFAAHARALALAGADPSEVRRPNELRGKDGLVIPGGESTTLLKLMAAVSLEAAITEFHRTGGSIFGTCAGLILLAREVRRPAQRSLGLLDVVVERNGYGRQVDSFAATGTLSSLVLPPEMEMVFIRAPRILSVDASVEVLGRCRDEAVLVRGNRILASTFHPELTAENAIHRYFVEMTRKTA